MKTVSEPRKGTASTEEPSAVDDLLLRIELAESAEERDCLQAELEELVAVDEEFAKAYRAHCQVERELRQLFENPEFRAELKRSPIRGFFRRLRQRFWPGAVC